MDALGLLIHLNQKLNYTINSWGILILFGFDFLVPPLFHLVVGLPNVTFGTCSIMVLGSILLKLCSHVHKLLFLVSTSGFWCAVNLVYSWGLGSLSFHLGATHTNLDFWNINQLFFIFLFQLLSSSKPFPFENEFIIIGSTLRKQIMKIDKKNLRPKCQPMSISGLVPNFYLMELQKIDRLS